MKTLILVFFCLFLNTQTRAADAAATFFEYVYTADNQIVATPILPIEPTKKASIKKRFWQKTKLQKQSEVKPITKFWYLFIGVLVSIFGGLIVLGSFFSLISILSFGSFSLISIIGVVIYLILSVPFILYAIKLFAAYLGKADTFLKGQRFLLGYICSILWILAGIIFVLLVLALAAWAGGTSGVGAGLFFALLIGVGVPLGVLIFNIIDHIRFLNYQKEQIEPSEIK